MILKKGIVKALSEWKHLVSLSLELYSRWLFVDDLMFGAFSLRPVPSSLVILNVLQQSAAVQGPSSSLKQVTIRWNTVSKHVFFFLLVGWFDFCTPGKHSGFPVSTECRFVLKIPAKFFTLSCKREKSSPVYRNHLNYVFFFFFSYLLL